MAYTTIDKPEGYFNTALWTGNNSSPRDIATGHATDFVWVKFRSSAFNHRLFDNVRGGSKKLISNNTDAEDTGATNDVTGFVSTGFTIGANINNSADGTVVGWSWKANGTGSSNTAGTITSTVSANTTSGFSIVSYTGTGANATVGHGIGVAPRMIIVKRRDSTANWFVYHASIGNNGYVMLNLTDAKDQPNSTVWNNTSPTSSLFSLGTSSGINASGGTYIAYCFAEVKGYSKFGSYTGNGSTDGTFIYTGFTPAFVMFKRTDSADQWTMMDNKRATFNVMKGRLYAESSSAEETTYNVIDFCSNGIKLRLNGGDTNGSGGSYIYMCFASSPFVSSKGIPTTAR